VISALVEAGLRGATSDIELSISKSFQMPRFSTSSEPKKELAKISMSNLISAINSKTNGVEFAVTNLGVALTKFESLLPPAGHFSMKDYGFVPVPSPPSKDPGSIVLTEKIIADPKSKKRGPVAATASIADSFSAEYSGEDELTCPFCLSFKGTANELNSHANICLDGGASKAPVPSTFKSKFLEPKQNKAAKKESSSPRDTSRSAAQQRIDAKLQEDQTLKKVKMESFFIK
jgi:hypothetical protein